VRPTIDQTTTERNEILRGERLGGLDPRTLAEEFGTPLYVYDFDVIEAQAIALREALPARFDVAYAVKANPALAVVAHLASLGLGLDVASGGELELASRAGVPAERVVFTGPGKRDQELAAAVSARVRAVTIESISELERLDRASAAAGHRTQILLRASSATDGGEGVEPVRVIGDEGAGKFGMDRASLSEAARRAARSAHLDLLGVHAFSASNLLDPETLAEHARQVVALGRTLAREAGFTLRLVDIGGGLGIPYGDDDDPLDLHEFGLRLHRLDEEMATDPVTRRTRILLEPGRFLVGPAGAFLARVVDRKAFDGRTTVILDGGINNLLRPALVGQQHRARAFGRGDHATPVPVILAGPLCSGLDIVGRNRLMAPPAIGDLVALLDAGAYGFTESMPLFLSHPIPAEVAIRGGHTQLIRPRMDPAAWLELQRIPTW
jgi:diaminopimelate decarboxylase